MNDDKKYSARRNNSSMDYCGMQRTKIQVLYDACSAIFSQKQLPCFQQIQWLKNILDMFEAVDVGIDEVSLHGRPQGLIWGQAVSNITYIHIHECDEFSIGVFCFPAGATLPLHDHPGMTVLSKLLYGSLYVKAYDWLKVEKSSCGISGVAGRVIDGIFNAPCETTILFPRSGGNIHSFTALTPCAILDVLSPPYSQDLGRPSTYFSDFPIPSLPAGYAMLVERDMPRDLVVAGAPYLGPPVNVNRHWHLGPHVYPEEKAFETSRALSVSKIQPARR